MLTTKDGIMVVLSSPSGAGKTTLTKMLAKKNQNFVISVSCTTREPRQHEIDGKDYHFVDKKKFEKLIKENSCGPFRYWWGKSNRRI